VGEGEDVQEGGLDSARPPLGEGEIGDGIAHHRPPESPSTEGLSGGYEKRGNRS
jgi:hypothetical protein